MDSDAWVRRFHPSPDAPVRLVCLPHAGGSAPFYFPVSATLSPDVDVLAVQYPGRQDRRREPLIDSIPALTEQVYAAIEPWTEGPFALFGHSMGATVAFELSRRLERAGRVPLRLFASGRRAPSRHRDERVHTLPEAGLIADLKQLSGTDLRIFGEEELLRLVLPVIRNDYKAAETYAYQAGPDLSCPVTVLVGDRDPKVSLDEAGAWREHTSGACDLKVFPGGHFYLVQRQAEVIGEISARLAVSAYA